MTRERYEQAYTYQSFLDDIEKHEGLWRGIYRHQEIPEDAVERLRNLPGPRRMLILAEDWCGDAASLVPILARMADAAEDGLGCRLLKRDENLDLMDDHLSHGGRAIPVAIVYDDAMRKLGWWGPRPAPAQALFREKQRALESGELNDKSSEVYQPVLRWYREDRGRHTIDEVLNVLERGGALRS